MLNSLANKKKMFVAVVSESKKRKNEKYIYEVKFLVKKLNYFVFPQLEDISSIDETEIKAILNAPCINSRGHYKFDVEQISMFNIE